MILILETEMIYGSHVQKLVLVAKLKAENSGRNERQTQTSWDL